MRLRLTHHDGSHCKVSRTDIEAWRWSFCFVPAWAMEVNIAPNNSDICHIGWRSILRAKNKFALNSK